MLGEKGFQFINDVDNEAFTIRASGFELACNLLIGLWFKDTKRKIFEFLLELPDAKPASERCVDIEGRMRPLLAHSVAAFAGPT